MKKTVTNMERIIAKIDNDFNPDNSDWIPRVAAWAIDAMSILKVNIEEVIKKQYKVVERIAYNSCGFGDNIVKVYDSNGCEIKELDDRSCQSCNIFTGESNGTDATDINATNDFTVISNTMAHDNNISNIGVSVAIETTKGNEPMSHQVFVANKYNNSDRNYVKIGDNKIELNFDTSFITVVNKSIKTECSEMFGCELPVIPNNGLLIECIVAWCMYKMLCRGYKHPVFNLRDNSPAINPFIFWIQNKGQAKDSVDIYEQGDIDSKLWRSAFYIDTFDPRR